MYEGRIVGEYGPDVTDGGARDRDDRRRPRKRRRDELSESPERRAARRTPPADAGPPSVAARMAFYQRAGGIVTPILTAVLAFFVGGVVVAATGHNPLTTYKEIFNGTGLNWFFQVGSYEIGLPWTDARVWFSWNVNDAESEAAFNLQQTLLDRGAARLHGPRGRVRLPLRHVQHRRPGPVHRRRDGVGLGRLLVGRDEPRAAHRARDRAGGARGGDLGWDRRLPEGDGGRARGDHDDHAQLDRLLGRQLRLRPRRAAPERLQRVGAGLERRRRGRQAAGRSGATRCCRGSTSASSSRSRRSSSTG